MTNTLVECKVLEFVGSWPRIGTDTSVRIRDVADLGRFLSGDSTEDLPSLPGSTSPKFIFADVHTDRYKDKNNNNNVVIPDHVLELLKQFETAYGVPSQLWTKPYWESNGYFGCDVDDIETPAHRTWFFFLIKQITKDPEQMERYPEVYKYVWYKMAFFTDWSINGSKSILCLNCPKKVIADIQSHLEDYLRDQRINSSRDPAKHPFTIDPYSFHQTIAHGMIHAYDRAIWDLKEVVREAEKKIGPARDFNGITEASRHLEHTVETLTNTQEVMVALINQHREYIDGVRILNGNDKIRMNCLEKTKKRLSFHRTVFYGLKARCDSLRARQANLNTLSITMSTARDAKFMKAIGLLTVFFLPMTTVATIFGMSFFNYDTGQNGPPDSSGGNSTNGEWMTSKKFWIFLAAAIPATIIVPLFFIKDILIKLRAWKKSITKWLDAAWKKLRKREKRAATDGQEMLDILS